jgi:hypothetical protein
VRHSLSERKTAGRSASVPLQSLLSTLESLLAFGFQSQWTRVFALIKDCIMHLPHDTFVLLPPLLESMDALYNSSELPQHLRPNLEDSFGGILSQMGPARLLSALPLNIDPSKEVHPFVESLDLFGGDSPRLLPLFAH